jgi:antitoxin CptB
MHDNEVDKKLAQVKWNCRRGMLELDMMLIGFCDAVYPTLNQEKQALFEELLQENDQDLQRWLVGAKVCEKPKFQDMLLIIRHEYIKNQRVVSPA